MDSFSCSFKQFAWFFSRKKKPSLDIYIWRLWPYVRADINETKESRALKNEKVPVFLVGDVGEGREHTLSTATAFEKGLFHTKTAFALATVVFFFCGVFVVQRYQISRIVFCLNK